MLTTQKPQYGKKTLSLPMAVIIGLNELPKGEQSSFAAQAIERELKLKKFKEMIENLRKSPPIKIKRVRGGWRKPFMLNLKP